MRAILIDPSKREITEVRFGGGNAEIYELLSFEPGSCDLFTIITLDEYNTLFLDDEGLLKSGLPVFYWGEYPHPLAGKALILGNDDEGDTISATYPLGAVIDAVRWTTLETTGDVHAGNEPSPEQRAAGVIYVGGAGVLRDNASKPAG